MDLNTILDHARRDPAFRMALADQWRRRGFDILKRMAREDADGFRGWAEHFLGVAEALRIGSTPSDDDLRRIVERAVAMVRKPALN